MPPPPIFIHSSNRVLSTAPATKMNHVGSRETASPGPDPRVSTQPESENRHKTVTQAPRTENTVMQE